MNRQQALGFESYSQSLPETGFTGCRSHAYVRKHNPAADWQGANVAADQNRAFSDFPDDFNELPTVSFVIPDLDHDMHDASIAAGDRWLRRRLGDYAQWAQSHNSVLIVTWDEDDLFHHNRIPTVFVGEPVEPGHYARQINHYSILRTLEEMYNLPLLGHSAQAVPITKVWRSGGDETQAHAG